MDKMMKAAVVERPGVITVRQVEVPEINDNEVLIQVKYTGICGTDGSIYTGKYSADKLPLISGHEFSGIISKVGKNSRGLNVGDRVTADINMSCGTCYYCRHGQKLLCPEFTQLGIHTNGSFAEYVKAPWQQVIRIPDELSFLKAAFIEPVSCVVHSAKALNVEAGSTVAVIGSGLGILHGALAKLRGATQVIVFGSNEYRLDIAKNIGIDYTFNIKNCDPVEEVMKLTEGRGADYVIEAVGTTATYEQALAMLRRGGTMAAFGITEGDAEIKVKPFDLVLGERKIVSSCAGVGQDWDDAIALLANNRIDVEQMFSMIVPLEELEDALKELRTNRKLFKVFVSAETTKREML